MKINAFISALALMSILSISGTAPAQQTILSDFFQDWTLDSTQSSSSCPFAFTGRPGTSVPGSTGMPGPNYDLSTSLRLTNEDSGVFEILDLGKNQGFTMTLVGNELKITNKRKFLGSYTLLADGGLVTTSGPRKTQVNCIYKNAHQEAVGKIEVGAALFIDGKKVAECEFEPATPRQDQINFVYNEKCTLGRYTKKSYIDIVDHNLGTEMTLSSKATRDLEIVRSTRKLNAATENYISFDSEIATKDSEVDDVIENNSEYYANPYETNQYKVEDTTAVIQFEYAPPALN